MKPNDKAPDEMLDDIRERASKAGDAAYALAWAVTQMQDTYPNYPARNEIGWWWKVTMNFCEEARSIEKRAEKLADAEDETSEGGEE